MGCNCGGRGAGARTEFQAKANNGKTETFSDSPSARLFLAQNGGGSVKTVPKK